MVGTSETLEDVSRLLTKNHSKHIPVSLYSEHRSFCTTSTSKHIELVAVGLHEMPNEDHDVPSIRSRS
jgi:hypothetical protein